MKTQTVKINEHEIKMDVFEMDAVEAIDVFGQNPKLYDSGGFRVEGFVDGIPAGTLFYSYGLDSFDIQGKGEWTRTASMFLRNHLFFPFPNKEPDHAAMVPFTLIDWINGKAVKLYEDYLEFGFDIDANPGWWDMPF